MQRLKEVGIFKYQLVNLESMKKFLISLIAMATAFSASAAINYTAKAKLKITSADGYYSTLTLAEAPEAAANTGELYEAGNPIIAIYAMYNNKRCETLRLPELGSRAIGFKATTATSYKVTVESASGNTLYLKANNQIYELTTAIAGDDAIVITISDAEKNTYVENKMELYVDNPTYTREGLTVGNLYTFCVPGAVDADKYEGAMFFKVNTFDGTSNVDLVEVEALEAGMPYFFEATATTLKVWETAGTETTAGSENGLYGWLDDEPLAIDGTEGISILKNNVIYPAGAGLFVGKNRAYLKLDEIVEAETSNVKVGGQHRVISGHNAATGVENVVLNGGLQKVMVDGQLMIIREGHMYNAAGVQVK